MKKLLLIALATSAMSAHAWEPNLYAGSNFSSWQYTQSRPALGSNFNLWTLEGVAGVELFPYVTLEGRAGVGLNNDRLIPEGSAQMVGIEATYFGSVYFRPVLENDKASLYGLLGYTSMEFEGTVDEVAGSYSHDGLSLGMGVSFVMNDKVDFHAEWKQLLDAESVRVRGASVGFTYTF